MEESFEHRKSAEWQNLTSQFKNHKMLYQNRPLMLKDTSTYLNFIDYVSQLNRSYAQNYLDQLKHTEKQILFYHFNLLIQDLLKKFKTLSEKLEKKKVLDDVMSRGQTNICLTCAHHLRQVEVQQAKQNIQFQGKGMQNQILKLIKTIQNEAKQEIFSHEQDVYFYRQLKSALEKKQEVMQICNSEIKQYTQIIQTHIAQFSYLKDTHMSIKKNKDNFSESQNYGQEMLASINSTINEQFKNKIPLWISKIIFKMQEKTTKERFQRMKSVQIQTDTYDNNKVVEMKRKMNLLETNIVQINTEKQKLTWIAEERQIKFKKIEEEIEKLRQEFTKKVHQMQKQQRCLQEKNKKIKEEIQKMAKQNKAYEKKNNQLLQIIQTLQNANFSNENVLASQLSDPDDETKRQRKKNNLRSSSNLSSKFYLPTLSKINRLSDGNQLLRSKTQFDEYSIDNESRIIDIIKKESIRVGQNSEPQIFQDLHLEKSTDNRISSTQMRKESKKLLSVTLNQKNKFSNSHNREKQLGIKEESVSIYTKSNKKLAKNKGIESSLTQNNKQKLNTGKNKPTLHKKSIQDPDHKLQKNPKNQNFDQNKTNQQKGEGYELNFENYQMESQNLNQNEASNFHQMKLYVKQIDEEIRSRSKINRSSRHSQEAENKHMMRQSIYGKEKQQVNRQNVLYPTQMINQSSNLDENQKQYFSINSSSPTNSHLLDQKSINKSKIFERQFRNDSNILSERFSVNSETKSQSLQRFKQQIGSKKGIINSKITRMPQIPFQKINEEVEKQNYATPKHLTNTMSVRGSVKQQKNWRFAMTDILPQLEKSDGNHNIENSLISVLGEIQSAQIKLSSKFEPFQFNNLYDDCLKLLKTNKNSNNLSKLSKFSLTKNKMESKNQNLNQSLSLSDVEMPKGLGQDLFISEQVAYSYEIGFNKKAEKQKISEMSNESKKKIDSLFVLLNLVRQKNSELYQQICSYLRYPYMTIKNTRLKIDVMQNMTYHSYFNIIERILWYHNKCGHKPIEVCEHFNRFIKRVANILSKYQ